MLKKTTISFSECMIQVFTFHFFGCLEIFILVLMAVDHYVAICKPLHYTTIMGHWVCGVLMSLAWLGSCVHSAAQILLALSLPFCGPNVINHYFCDLQPLLKLACTDTYVTDLLLVSNSGAICTVSIVMLYPVLSSCILWETTVLTGGKKRSRPASPTSLWSSCSLVLAYLYTLALQPPSPWIRW